MAECRKCLKQAHQIGGYLRRVNEKGVPGIWECAPTCDADLPFDTRLLLAMDDAADEQQTIPTPEPQS
jgi:hypothetical protein